ncbi:hypothetical protein [Dactylosporangium sp. NPDC051541]|uniref:hypothetical protein n=1 Tax=Dactylosporangium sp. NPDC051541 TaxID=3363977 RepID=UPI0037874F8E
MNPLQELHDLDAPGTELTAEGLVRAGRDRVRRRRRAAMISTTAAVALILTAGVAALAAVRPPVEPDPAPMYPQPTSSAPGCRAQWLPVPKGTETSQPLVDSTGLWAAAEADGGYSLVIWRDGAVAAEVPALEHSMFSIVGISATGSVLVARAHRWRIITPGRSETVELSLPPDANPSGKADVTGMNAAGDVVGYATFADGQRAMLWRHGDGGRPTVLATPEGLASAAFTIADNGSIGGYVDDHKASRRPYVWRADGTGLVLPMPDDVPNGSVSELVGDRAVDFARGLWWQLSEEPGGPEPQWLATGSGGGRVMAADGTIAVGTGGDAVLWGSGGTVRLPAQPGFERYYVSGMSADGRVIAGSAVDEAAASAGRPLRWVCGA